jgi:large subunit ribosomal protein L18Ae
VKRDNTIQFLGRKEPVSFPVVNKVLRPDAKSQKTTFKYSRPNFSAL